MATKDVRYYLNGICLRIDAGIEGQAYSTDGHVLFVCKFEIENNADAIKGIFDLLIPVEAVKHAAKGKNTSVELISMDDGSYLLDGMRFLAIDGKYPDITRVMPDSKSILKSGDAGNFNPALLVRCSKSLATWHDTTNPTHLALYQNGPDKSAVMQGPDNSALCVIMPHHIDAPDKAYSFNIISTTE